MAALDSAWVQGLLWAVAVAGAVWALVPALAFPFFPRRFDNEVIEDLREAQPRGDDHAYEEWFHQFAALGFVPMGKMKLSAWFFTPLHWRWRADGTRVLGLRDGTIFVHLHRVAGADPLSVNLTTAFHEGGMLETVTPGGRATVNRGNDRRREIEDADAATLVEQHQQDVAEHARARSLTVKRSTFREMADDSTAYEQRMVPRSKVAGTYLVLAFVGMVAFHLFAEGRRAGLLAWSLPVALCCAAAVYVVCRWTVLPGRVPMPIRVLVMLAVIYVPTWVTSGLPGWLTAIWSD